MGGIIIPQRRKRTQTPTPSSASVDTRPLEAALTRLGETVDALGRAREAARLRDARADLYTGLADLDTEAFQDTGFEDLEERFSEDGRSIAASAAESYGLSGNALKQFEKDAQLAIMQKRVAWASSARKREVEHLSASVSARVRAYEQIGIDADDPEMSDLAIAQIDLEYGAAVEEGTLRADVAESMRQESRKRLFTGLGERMLLVDQQRRDGEPSAFRVALEGGAFSELDARSRIALENKHLAQEKANLANRAQGEAADRARRNDARSEAERELLTTMTLLNRDEPNQSKRMDRLNEMIADASDGQGGSLYSGAVIAQAERLALGGALATDTQEWRRLRTLIDSGHPDPESEIRSAGSAGLLTSADESGLMGIAQAKRNGAKDPLNRILSQNRRVFQSAAPLFGKSVGSAIVLAQIDAENHIIEAVGRLSPEDRTEQKIEAIGKEAANFYISNVKGVGDAIRAINSALYTPKSNEALDEYRVRVMKSLRDDVDARKMDEVSAAERLEALSAFYEFDLIQEEKGGAK